MERRKTPANSNANGNANANADADDDASLFRDAIGDVRPLRPAPVPPARPRPRPSARMAQRDADQARHDFVRSLARDAIESGDALAFRRDQVTARVLRRLQRGDYAAQAEVDLHGLDAAGAERVLRRFLHDFAHEGGGCARIVHGKGLGSGSVAPVLKNLVDRLLRQRADVLAFHSAPAAQGGTGAVLVLVRGAR